MSSVMRLSFICVVVVTFPRNQMGQRVPEIIGLVDIRENKPTLLPFVAANECRGPAKDISRHPFCKQGR